jgi:DNA-directed RNA polymerase subunit omega (EC 2.7.7.6)
MFNPPLSTLLEKINNRYTLVIATAKRARMLTNGAEKLTNCPSTKDVTIAIQEIAEGKIGYHKVQRKPDVTSGEHSAAENGSGQDAAKEDNE